VAFSEALAAISKFHPKHSAILGWVPDGAFRPLKSPFSVEPESSLNDRLGRMRQEHYDLILKNLPRPRPQAFVRVRKAVPPPPLAEPLSFFSSGELTTISGFFG